MWKTARIFFCLCPVYSVSALANNGTSNYPRFVEAPIGGNKTTLIDLKEKPNMDQLNSLTRSFGLITNRYLLFTRSNPNVSQSISQEDDSIKSSNFNPKNPTVVLIHGWMNNINSNFYTSTRNVLLSKGEYNVIVVDWDIISSSGYVLAMVAVPSVGRNVGQFMNFLHKTTGASLTSMHIVGHSLGAHAAGNAGRELDGKVGRITGLDPAGPLWDKNPKRLQAEDGLYVEAIHTNAHPLLGFGIIREVGDVDFYVNGGSSQPGCLTTNCNHSRSYQLFVASIEFPNHFIGTRCSGFAQMLVNQCSGERLPLGNADMTKRGKGIYRVNTGGAYPY